MNGPPPSDPRIAALTALPIAMMGFAADGALLLITDEMRELLRIDAAAMPLGTPEAEVFRRLAFQGVLGAGEPEQRAREVMVLSREAIHRRIVRDIAGRALELRLAPLAPAGRLLTIADVSEYVQAREAAEAEARALDDIANRLSTGIAQFDAHHRLRRNNKAYARLINVDERHLPAGISVPEIVRLQQAAGEFDAGQAEEIIQSMAAYPRGRDWSKERTRPDGRTLRFDNRPMPDGGWLAEVTDITDKHEAEQSARRRIALHDALMEALPVGVAVYGPDRSVTMVNPAYNEIMAHSPIRVGESLRDILWKRAVEGEFGPCDPAQEVPRRLSRVNTRHSFDRRSPNGLATTHRSVPLPDGGHAMVVADVTALHAAQAEARERAELLGTMLDNMRHGIAMFDEHGTVVAANRLAAELSGVPPEKYVAGVTLDRLREIQIESGVHGDDETTEQFIRLRRGRELKGPDRYQRRNRHGQVIEVITDRMPSGGYVRSYTDVTAQVAAEADARNRATTLQAVLDNMRHGVFLYDPEGYLRVVNDLGARLSGIPPELAKPGVHFTQLRDAQIAQGELGIDLEGKRHPVEPVMEPWRLATHYTRRRPDGTIIEVRTDITPDGGAIRSFTDITALTQAQAEAASRATVLQAMLDNMRHGIALFDSERVLVSANALAGQLMGIPEGLHPGMTHREVLDAEAASGEFGPPDVAAAWIARVLGNDLTQPHITRRRRPDGTELEVGSSPVPDGGFVLTLTDITARVVAEREAERRAEVLGTTLNAARQGITLYDGDNRVVAANDIAARLAGFAQGQDMVGLRHEEIVLAQQRMEGASAEEDASRLEYHRAMDRSRPLRYQRRRRDGVVLDVSSDPTSNGGYVVSVSDVTELVMAREQAQAQARALAVTLDASRHAIALYDADSRLIAGNRIAARVASFAGLEMMTGRTFEEVIRHQAPLDYPGDPEAAERFATEILALDRSKPIRYQRRRPDGIVLDVASDPTPEGGFVISVSDVTPLVDAQEEAQRRAGIMQVMLENSRQGIVLYDAEQRLVAANALAGELMGVPDLLRRPGITQREILVEQRARGIFGADATAENWENYFQQLDRTQPQRVQRNLPDGRRLDIASDPTPDGGHVVSISDISALVRAEEAAEQRAGVLKTMLENNISGVMLYDRDSRLVAFNALAAEMTGMPGLGGLIGQTLAQNLEVQAASGNFGSPEAAEARRRRLLSLDRSKSHRSQRVTEDGRVLVVASDPTPDGGFVISLQDVTAVARAEAEVARRAEILGMMLGNIRHGIMLFGADRRLVAANPKMHEMLELPEGVLRPGITHEEMVDIFFQRGEYGQGPEGRARSDAIKYRDRAKPILSVRTRPDGAILEVVSDPTPDGGWVVTYTDVTEDRRIRAELDAAREAAEAASRAKSRFLATMSHELRTPLNAVIGFSEVLQGGATPEQVQEFAASIQEAGRHLLTLIDDILDVTRAEGGSLPVVIEKVSLQPLMEGAVRIIGGMASSSGLQLRLDAPEHLPQLRADERRLRQVLLNLLSNATKFTPQGGQVTLSARLATPGLVIEVKDTGIGIEPKDLARVFEPFTQLDSALSRRFPGSGLGLHLCRALIEAQGGTLELESTPGQGTTARITFPADHLLAPDRVLVQPHA
ncbi:PAS-domain containing protein [Roseococcus sp. YIM B11640]|uniref:PAS-domain containing protein n=1 Tax=Roseococcus sp. YIM B11640 TaxID=3133973 RepID=UPI003C7D729A